MPQGVFFCAAAGRPGGHGPAGDARDAVNKSRELCDAIIMVARSCIELPIVSISAETDGGLL